jgi:hypothetical protein
MKIKINFTLDVDPDSWAREYDIEKSEVRDDVKMYVKNGMLAHFEDFLPE